MNMKCVYLIRIQFCSIVITDHYILNTVKSWYENGESEDSMWAIAFVFFGIIVQQTFVFTKSNKIARKKFLKETN